MKIVKYSIAFLLTALFGGGLAYFMMPQKVVIKTQVKTIHVVDKNTITIIVKKPDGTTITHIINKDKINDKTDSKTATIKLYDRPNWTIQGNYSTDRFGNTEFGGAVYRRVLGPISVGLIGSSRGTVGVGIQLQF